MSDLAIVLPEQVTETSLRLPELLTRDEWYAVGHSLSRIQSGVLWWLGDWWNYGQQRQYGDMAAPGVKHRLKAVTGHAYDTLVVCGWVADRFENLRRRRNLTFAHHVEVAALPAEIADRWLDLAEEHKWSKNELRRRVKRGLPDENGAVILPPSVDLRVGDFREVLGALDAGSVDAIITDPPYPARYVPLYGDLAEQAGRVLRPGGSLLCMVGQSYLPDVLNLMTPHLRYRWQVCYLTPGGQSVQLWDRTVNTFWKPVLWFVHGEYDGDWVGDVVRSDVNDNDKRFHDWGQSESGMTGLVERFSEPGDLLVDPFLGGGTTGLVAVSLGRRFLGCDVDAEAVAVARRRLALPAPTDAEAV